jgi:hypothetical protein
MPRRFRSWVDGPRRREAVEASLRCDKRRTMLVLPLTSLHAISTWIRSQMSSKRCQFSGFEIRDGEDKGCSGTAQYISVVMLVCYSPLSIARRSSVLRFVSRPHRGLSRGLFVDGTNQQTRSNQIRFVTFACFYFPFLKSARALSHQGHILSPRSRIRTDGTIRLRCNY